MVSSLRINISGREAVTQMLDDLNQRSHDLTPVWHRVVDRFGLEMIRQFDTQGVHLGESWAALSPRYSEWKEQHFPGQPLLRLRDLMYRELTQAPSVSMTSRTLVISILSPYAMFHQEGTSRMPARPLLGDPNRLIRPLEDLIISYIRGEEQIERMSPEITALLRGLRKARR